MADRWWNSRLSDWFGAHQESEEKRSLISRLASSFERSQALTKLNLGVIKFAPAKPAQPDFQWSQAAPVTSARGSVVPSPSLDQYYRFWRLGQSPDLIERRRLYDEFDKIFSTSVIIAEAAAELTNGAFRNGIITKIVPAKGYEQDPQAQDQAALADDIWQPTMRLATVEWFCLLSNCVIRYGNGPTEIVVNDNGGIEELRQLSPYAMQINSGPNLKFYPNQKDAYVQFDDSARTWIARWPEALIVFLMTKDLAWHRYGMGRIYAALSSARALIRAEATLPDSREAGQLQKFERYSDPAGNPAPIDTIEDARILTDEALKERGEQLSPFRTRIYNGPVEVGMMAPPTGFYNELEDIRWHASGSAMRLGSQLASLIAPETINRATMDRINEMQYQHQAEWGIQLSEMTLPPIFERQAAWHNGLMEGKKSFYALSTVQSKIDLRKVRMEITRQAVELPERLVEKAKSAGEGYDKSLLDWESAVECYAMAAGKDPEIVKARLREEKAKREQATISPQISTPNKSALRAVN